MLDTYLGPYGPVCLSAISTWPEMEDMSEYVKLW